MTQMMITRKGFLGAAASGSVLLLLQACGGGGSSSADAGTTPPASKSCGANGSAIAGNHGHSLSIPVADLDSTTDKVYSIQGSATHDHTVTLTPAQLQSIKGGHAVIITSSTNASHSHDVTSNCA